MADPVVHITAGIPDSGTGNITTLGQTLVDGANATLGATTDAAIAAGAAGTINAHLRSISRDIATGVVIASGGNTIGNVGQAGAPWSQNVSQFGGAAVVTGTGIGGAGVPRVTVSSDSSLAATQSGTWNITNITGTVPLPTGAATSAKQPALGTAGVPSADVISVQGVAGGTAQPVSIAASVTVVQPTAANLNATVTGTVAVSGVSSVKPDGTVWTLTGSSANVNVSGGSISASQSGNWTTRMVGNLGAALDAVQNAAAPANELVVGGVYNSAAPTLTSGNASQLQLDVNGNLNVNIKAGAGSGGTASSVGAALPGQGTLALGSVTTAAPSYTTATANALSLTTVGNLRVDGSSVTQPVSGTFWQATQPISAAALPLPSGAATAANQTNVQGVIGAATAPASMSVVGGVFNTTKPTLTTGQSAALQSNTSGILLVDGSGVTQPISGNVGVTGSVAVTGTFWQATQPVSGTVTANQGGAPWTVKPDGTVWSLTSTSANVNVTNTVPARVTGSAGGIFDFSSAQNVATPNSAILTGAEYNSSPTAITSGNSSPLQADKQGRLLAVGAVRTSKGKQKTSITATSETTVVTAGAAGVFNDVYAFVCTNKSATSVFVDFKDSTAGTTQMTLAVPANDTRGFTVPVDSAMPQTTAANNWTATVSAAVTSIEITALYVSNI
jgi:hypothetical protein